MSLERGKKKSRLALFAQHHRYVLLLTTEKEETDDQGRSFYTKNAKDIAKEDVDPEMELMFRSRGYKTALVNESQKCGIYRFSPTAFYYNTFLCNLRIVLYSQH